MKKKQVIHIYPLDKGKTWGLAVDTPGYGSVSSQGQYLRLLEEGNSSSSLPHKFFPITSSTEAVKKALLLATEQRLKVKSGTSWGIPKTYIHKSYLDYIKWLRKHPL